MTYTTDAYRAARDAGNTIRDAYAAGCAEARLEDEAHAINDAATLVAPIAESLAATNTHYAKDPRVDARPCEHDDIDDLDPFEVDLADFKQCNDCGEYLDGNGETTWDPRSAETIGRAEYRRLVA